MIKNLFIPRTRRRVSLVRYVATDWVLLPAVVFNPSPAHTPLSLFSVQWLKWGLGVGFWSRRRPAATRPLLLRLDEADWDTVQSYIADYQATNHFRDGGTIVPEGESNLAGAVVAEGVRNLLEYRQMFTKAGGTDAQQ